MMCKLKKVVYNEVRRLNRSLKLCPDVSDIEKKINPYIYVDNDKRNKSNKKKYSDTENIQSYIESCLMSNISALICLIKCDDSLLRRLTLQSLARHNKHLTDAECSSIAQALDFSTTVVLARTEGVDMRLFRQPPPLPPIKNGESLANILQDLVMRLPLAGVNKCTQHLIESIRQRGIKNLSSDQKTALWSFGDSDWQLPVATTTQIESTQQLYLLQALLGHSQTEAGSICAVKQGALAVLRRLLSNNCDIDIQRSIARIIANLGLYNQTHPSLYMTGWLTILAGWLRSSDLTLSLLAGKAMANIESSSFSFSSSQSVEPRYLDGIYLYHPLQTSINRSQSIKADVVFFHGLLGGPFRTWRQKDRERFPQSQPPSSGAPTSSQKTSTASTSIASASTTSISTASTFITKNSVNNTHKQRRAATMEQNQENENILSADLKTQNSSCRASVTGYNSKNSKPQNDEFEYTLCWPKDWLAADCENIRIISVEFETRVSEWNPTCPYELENRTLIGRSALLIDKLKEAGLGQRPIIWIGHSMGGLVIKQILTTLADRNEAAIQRTTSIYNKQQEHTVEEGEWRGRTIEKMGDCEGSSEGQGDDGLLEWTRGCVFYSVPHFGAMLVKHSKLYAFLKPSIEVKQLVVGSDMLKELHTKFRSIIEARCIPLLSFAEGQDTKLLFYSTKIVPEQSSDPGFGEYHLMADLNHLNICKPDCRDSAIYRRTLQFIRHSLSMPLS